MPPILEVGMVIIFAVVIFWAIRVQVELGKVLRERDHAVAENKELQERLVQAARPPVTDAAEQSGRL